MCSSLAPKPAWAKPTGLLFSRRDNQPGGIEVWLGKNELFENAGRYGLRDAALRRLIAPDFRDARADRYCETCEIDTRRRAAESDGAEE